MDQLLEALRRFTADGLIDESDGTKWLREMQQAHADFVRCYDEATPEEESIAIARRYSTRP